jgi:hypothetical protein
MAPAPQGLNLFTADMSAIGATMSDGRKVVVPVTNEWLDAALEDRRGDLRDRMKRMVEVYCEAGNIR